VYYQLRFCGAHNGSAFCAYDKTRAYFQSAFICAHRLQCSLLLSDPFLDLRVWVNQLRLRSADDGHLTAVLSVLACKLVPT
jgi:hypothetical protein